MNEPFMYVVLIGLVILVFSSILPKVRSRNGREDTPQIVQEMEETMEGFLAEIEEDNKKLIDTMAAMTQEHNQAVRRLTERMDVMEQQFQEERQDWRRLALQRMESEGVSQRESVHSSVPAQDASMALQTEQPEKDPGKDTSPESPTIRSRYEELFRMHDEGKSAEYIAKNTGMNKGEVSLIIQLAIQEERKGAEK